MKPEAPSLLPCSFEDEDEDDKVVVEEAAGVFMALACSETCWSMLALARARACREWSVRYAFLKKKVCKGV